MPLPVVDPAIFVQNPSESQTRGRPSIPRRTLPLRSTRRNPSQFELVGSEPNPNPIQDVIVVNVNPSRLVLNQKPLKEDLIEQGLQRSRRISLPDRQNEDPFHIIPDRSKLVRMAVQMLEMDEGTRSLMVIVIAFNTIAGILIVFQYHHIKVVD